MSDSAKKEEVFPKSAFEKASINFDAIKIRYDGVFDYYQFYINMFEFLIEWGYVNGDSYKYMENYWSEVHRADGKEIWWWWKTERKEDGNPLYTFHIDYVFHFKKVKDHEIIENGKKFNVQKGQARVYFYPSLKFDEENNWKKNWLLRNELVQRYFLYKFWWKRRSQKIGVIMADVAKVTGHVKRYFELQPYTATKEDDFFKSQGFKDRYE